MQSRRQFLVRSGAAGVAVLAPQAESALAASRPPTCWAGKFAEGVTSGEPAAERITLWTRVDGARPARAVELEIARDDDFRRVVDRRD